MSDLGEMLEKAGLQQLAETSEGFKACCPFHEDSKPSWAINRESGLWKCHGCGERGSLPSFVSRVYGIPLEEAKSRYLRYLEWPTLPERRDEADEVTFMDEMAVQVHLLSCPRYMLDRGFKKSFLRRYEIGYDNETMRVVIPVRDEEGRLVGVTRRATLPSQQPKYLHSEFKKARFLYLGQHLKRVRRGGAVIVTEGQLDALKVQALLETGGIDFGFDPDKTLAVATLGASLSKRQSKLLSYTEGAIVLAYDNDEAGVRGARKAAEALLNCGVRDLYHLAYQTKDPGELEPGAKFALEVY